MTELKEKDQEPTQRLKKKKKGKNIDGGRKIER